MRGHATFLPCPICGAERGERCRNLNTDGERSRPHMARRKPTPEHGSAAGYRRHLSKGEVACAECREAQARYAVSDVLELLEEHTTRRAS